MNRHLQGLDSSIRPKTGVAVEFGIYHRAWEVPHAGCRVDEGAMIVSLKGSGLMQAYEKGIVDCFHCPLPGISIDNKKIRFAYSHLLEFFLYIVL
jgi:hypothetical protein